MIVARFKASGEAEVGVFLVDVYCLGVKSAFFARIWADEYEQRLVNDLERQEGKVAIEPACARKLVEDAVTYARSLGFEPHPDYKQGARVFGGINPATCSRSFVFGDNGKPHYVQGPQDSSAFAAHALHTLKRRLGMGRFNFTILGNKLPPGFDSEDGDPGHQEPVRGEAAEEASDAAPEAKP